ncbi:MAG: RluA family pseudouridine synthase, partial [Anaerolineae bacterium]|nr:RluA family pseudouridine synthase [Anaerolineae bacterium]
PEWHTLEIDTPTRLDQLLARRWELLDHSRIREMVVQDAILINGQPAQNQGQWVTTADEVRVNLPEFGAVEAPKLRRGQILSVAYEDDAILMLDKPVGISVRRAGGSARAREQPTVPHTLAEMRPEIAHIGGVNRAGVVTTLDDDESGLILIGKTEEAYRELRRLIKHRYAVEAYTALIEGHLRAEYTIDEPIGNYKHTRRRLRVTREGRPARTFVRPQQHYKESNRDYTLVYVRPETSRMHQIRVHLAWFGFPIVGDKVYGSKHQMMLPDRLFLHLSQVQLKHPVSGKELTVESPLPQELHAVLQYMRRPKS